MTKAEYLFEKIAEKDRRSFGSIVSSSITGIPTEEQGDLMKKHPGVMYFIGPEGARGARAKNTGTPELMPAMASGGIRGGVGLAGLGGVIGGVMSAADKTKSIGKGAALGAAMGLGAGLVLGSIGGGLDYGLGRVFGKTKEYVV